MKHFLVLLNGILLVCVSFVQSRKLILPVGHMDKVTSATYSRDREKIFTSSGDYMGKITSLVKNSHCTCYKPSL